MLLKLLRSKNGAFVTQCTQVYREVPRHGHWSQSDRHACCSHLVSFLRVNWEQNSSTFTSLQFSRDQPVPSEHLLHQVDRDLDDLHHDLSLRRDLDGLLQGCLQDQDLGGERCKHWKFANQLLINISVASDTSSKNEVKQSSRWSTILLKSSLKFLFSIQAQQMLRSNIPNYCSLLHHIILGGWFRSHLYCPAIQPPLLKIFFPISRMIFVI